MFFMTHQCILCLQKIHHGKYSVDASMHRFSDAIYHEPQRSYNRVGTLDESRLDELNSWVCTPILANPVLDNPGVDTSLRHHKQSSEATLLLWQKLAIW